MATQISRIMSASPAQMALLAHLHSFPRDKLERTIEALIAIVDLIDGDLEAEPATFTEGGSRGKHADLPDDYEPSGDEQDIGWTEWQSRHRHKLTAGGYEQADQCEDDEEDDPSGQCDEDGINTAYSLIEYTPGSHGAGCPISDPDAEHDGREPDHDDEREQMEHDVPCIPVFTLEPNIFNGQRQLLGYTLPRPTRDGMEAEL